MSHISSVEIYEYLPPGVKRIIAHGDGSWFGEVDETTVLKYPYTKGEMNVIQIEAKILAVLGSLSRIVQSKGLTQDGLLLEFAANAYIHSKGVLHCDIRHKNVLLDSNLDIKLADVQGQHFSAAGEILLDGLSVEATKSYLPRKPADHASVRIDLFALGSCFFFIMRGREVFWDLDKSEDKDEIERLFREGRFPIDPTVCGAVITKCFRQLYSSAQEVLINLETVREAIVRGEILDSIERVVSVPNEEVLPPATPWLSGLCKEEQTPMEPPPYRQLKGFGPETSSIYPFNWSGR